MKKNILTIVVIALCLINLALSAVIVFSIVPMANRSNELITQVASVINLELEDPKAETVTGDVPVADREELAPIAGSADGEDITVNLKADGTGQNHVAMYNAITIIVNKKAKDYKDVTALITTNNTWINNCVSTALANRTYEDLQSDTDRSDLYADIVEQLNTYFNTTMICDVIVNGIKYQ